MPRPPLAPSELEQIAAGTLAHYQANAEAFRAGTRDHDVSQNIDALLRHLAADPARHPPFHILDLGCGPGRDLAAGSAPGHGPSGIDGTEGTYATGRR